jgi:RimJ/RimL family protein N-acetyltransferase
MTEIIGQLGGRSICRQYHIDEEVVHFLESVTWGVGDNQYEHYYTLHRLRNIPEPVFFLGREAGTNELIGAVVFGKRRVMGVKAYYIRFFAVAAKVRGQRITTPLAELLFDILRDEENEPVIFYATTDRINPGVNRLAARLGFEELTLNQTIGFSRFLPRPMPGVEVLSPEEFAAFLPVLEEAYAGHAFWTADNLGKDGHYFVLRENDQIVAGLQACKALWRVGKMPGFFGKVILPLLPYTPLRVIFNPRAFHFLAIEGIYIAPGYEHRLQDVLETALHHFKFHSALFWINIADPLRQRILEHNRMGLLHHFVKDTMSRFIASFHQVDPATEQELRRRPVYNSSIDSV